MAVVTVGTMAVVTVGTMAVVMAGMAHGAAAGGDDVIMNDAIYHSPPFLAEWLLVYNSAKITNYLIYTKGITC
jgi:hypothetical protein